MDGQQKFDAERFNALMKVADFRFQRWRERRTTDWQVTLALWTFLIAGSAYVYAQHIKFPRVWLALGLIALAIGHALLWARTNHNSSMFDIRVYFHFFDRAVDLVEPEAQVPVAPLPNRQEVEGSHGWSNFCHAGFWEFLLRESFCQAQVFITVFFAIVAFVILAFA